jgi:tetratricopeptide (TPR) repeat protein
MKAVCALLLVCWPLVADNWTAEGYEAFYNLDYDQAIADFEKAIAADPNNPNPHNHLAQALLYRELFRNGALESELVTGNNSFLRRPKMNPPPEVEKRFYSEISRAIELAQAQVDKNPRDTTALHALAVARGLRSNYNFLVRRAWKDALADATAARKLDDKVIEIDPANYDARIIQGIHDYVIGSLPWTWRALGFLAGFHGDKERGIRTLEDVVQKGRMNRTDAQILLSALYRREGQPKRALPLLTKLLEKYPRNYLLRFEQAHMYAALGERQNALDTLDEIAKMKQENVPGFGRIPWEKIYYETGNLEFWFNDLDHALENLKKVTASPQQLKELDLNTGVLAFMRQGQIHDLQNRRDLAIKAYEQAIQFAPDADAARESKRYMSSPYKRSDRS